MPRRKPQSAKQHKAKLQHKRAVKRGDAVSIAPSDPEPRPATSARVHRVSAHSTAATASLSSARDSAIASARGLQSSFVKLSPALLEQSKILADRVPLHRPIPSQAAVWPESSGRLDSAREREMREAMGCMRRPKWRYEMTKKEVEKNEEGLFAKWLSKTDGAVDEWVKAAEETAARGRAVDDGDRVQAEDDLSAPPSPSFFERNLEVWRQLWRVTELSQIILVLLDSRCPSLHFPPSLSGFLASPHYRLILVLTKVDIAGPQRADAWARYLRATHPGVRVVMVESYVQKASDPDPGVVQSGKRRYEPHLPQTFKERLIAALKDAHAEMLEPPERIKQDAERMKEWKPKVKRQVDFDALLAAGAKTHFGGNLGMPMTTENQDDDNREPDYLTIGLIGQPNVGKSSLLNALFGTIKVRASKTPGKTKHFQTLFWTPDVRLVDCPGLVMPDLMPMEMQVLGGILPISRMPAIPLCISYASQLLPLERVFGLVHPTASVPPPEDKRTWRDRARRIEDVKMVQPAWTAMDIMSAFADRKGWVTAKAGRSDVNRAGNAILRFLAEGKVQWAFWPPGTPASTVEAEQHAAGNGIWLSSATVEEAEEAESEYGSEGGGEGEGSAGTESGIEVVSEDEEDEVGQSNHGIGGRFAALQLVGDNGSEDEEEEEEEEGHFADKAS